MLGSLANGTILSVALSVGISALVVALTTRRFWISLTAIVSIAIAILLIVATVLWMGASQTCTDNVVDVRLGWTISVVEATIIILTIGLSFDYTLHYAVAFRMAPDMVVTERMT